MDMILKNTFQSISPAYELIGDVTVASNTTNVDFTGLNIGKDDELLLVSGNTNPTATGASVLIFYNGNTTQSNYYAQQLRGNGTGVTGARANRGAIYYNEGEQRANAFTTIKLANSGYAVAQSSPTERIGNSTVELWYFYSTSTFTMTSITSIRLYANQSNAIGTGSRFQLYKLVAEKVADIIVPSNTTSVDITGLDIGKDGEYYLVSDWVNGIASTNAIYLFVNGNNTTSNYYYQGLNANATTITAGRSAEAILSQASGPLKSFLTSNIKLTNSGYFVSQSNSNRNYGSGIILEKDYLTSTFTMSGVTSIRLHSPNANGIGANSRFTLYKMK